MGIQPRKPVRPELIEAIGATRAHAVAVAILVRYDFRDVHQRYLIAYLCTGIELAGAALVLAKSAETIGIPILARAALEAHVDFKCLIADPNYVELMEAAHDKEWARAIDRAGRSRNPDLVAMSQAPAAVEERARSAHREAHRKAVGIFALTAEQRFTQAGLLDLYDSAYNFLSAETHTNPRALITRHFREDADGQPKLAIYADDSAFVDMGLMHIHDALAEMTEGICKAFNVQEPDRTQMDAAYAAAKRAVENS